jgi:hypothetical protein
MGIEQPFASLFAMIVAKMGGIVSPSPEYFPA